MALRATTAEEWTTLLSNAGIPATEATKYANTFVSNRLTHDDLADLDKATLNTLDINVLGDQLAILRLTKQTNSHNTNVNDEQTDNKTYLPPPQKTISYKSPSASASVKLPTVTADMTHPQFRKFRVDWSVYKTITGIPTHELTAHLYSTCDPAVQNSIINAQPKFLSLDESTAIDSIEELVTKRANPTVHRMSFNSLKQSEYENIQEFIVRLRSSVHDCEFTCPNCNFDLSDINIRDQFIRGLNNSTLQTDILTKAGQLKTLIDVTNHAESVEAAIRDQTQLDNNKTTPDTIYSAQHSSYKQQKSSQSRYPNKQRQSCIGCGSTQHRNRLTKCPAWGQKCKNCGILNHFSSVCFRNQNESSVSSINLIAHVRYDVNSDTYTSNSNCSPDFLKATVTAQLTNFNCIKPVSMFIFPDSGASICLAGPQHLNHLGIDIKLLIPCNKRVTAVGGSVLSCRGWLPVEFNVNGQKTKQPLYICDKIDRLYFSKSACIDVSILPKSFPHPMKIDQALAVNTSHTTEKVLRTTPPARPTTIPFEPTPENIPKLKQFIIDKFNTSAFNKSAPFPAMSTEPAHIHLKNDAVPFARHSSIPVPHHWKAKIKEGLDRDVEKGIIKPVEIGTPVEWCSPMVIVTKKDGTPRRTVDLQRLNSQCLRETHHSQSPFQLASQVPPNTKKTVIDAVDGYHTIKLDTASQPLTTFITEWGRYTYLRMPQGFKASGDVYTRRYDDIISHVPNKIKIVGDTLLHSNTIEDSFFNTWDFLTLIASKGIVANVEKFQFCQDIVEFAGLTITSNGVTPSDNMLSAIKNFPTPTDITGARSWFGLINQVSWAYAISPIMQAFRDLIKPNVKFYWDSTLDDLFNKSKTEIVNAVKGGVQSFEPDRRTCLQTDWCRDSIGYLLLQQHCNCTSPNVPTCCPTGWKMIYAGSRFTNPAESRYSPTEGEALAVAWSLNHSRMFTLGCNNLVVSVDHKPLLGIFNNRELSSIKNPRIQNIKESTYAWQFNIFYNPGKWHIGPDAMSRNPTINS